MDKIGFSNFKKFKEFPSIDLAPITFIVGPNNSGKSSFIKAMTFLLYNIDYEGLRQAFLFNPNSSSSISIGKVSFYNKSLSHFDWGDFETTLNWEAEKPEITYRWSEGVFDFEFSFGTKLPIVEPSLQFTLPVNYLKIHQHKWKRKDASLADCDITSIYEMNSEGNLELQTTTIGKFPFMAWLKERLNEPEGENAGIQEALDVAENLIKDTIVIKGIRQNVAWHECPTFLGRSFAKYRNMYALMISESLLPVSRYKFCYIEAHNAPHDIAISAKNKDNYLAQTVAEFYASVPSDAKYKEINIHEWVCKWMAEFGIGTDFEIKPICGGEIFTVDILSYSGRTKPLATLGTGSIQMFILLLKMATILNASDGVTVVTVFIEEPEQNGHPKLQSKLADLFSDVNNMTDCIRFIVETHSEYIIRRTQVLVAESGYKTEKELEEKNPFKVYYFPEEGMPYDMKYRTDGCFSNEFGHGFFDEASKLAFKLF
jgi:AAA15 family ATPase/GTPase